MRRDENEMSEASFIDSVIEKSKVCRLGLVDGNKPYIVPLCFGYEENVLYFHAALEGRKIDILRANPNVCFEFDITGEITSSGMACGWGIEYQSVIGSGVAVFIEEPDEKRRALGAIVAQYSDRKFEFNENSMSGTTVFKVDIDSMTGKQSDG
jgi:uncharacterized protein